MCPKLFTGVGGEHGTRQPDGWWEYSPPVGKGSRRSTLQATSTKATFSSQTSWPRRTPQVPALPRTSQHLGEKGIEKSQKIKWTDTETSQSRAGVDLDEAHSRGLRSREHQKKLEGANLHWQKLGGTFSSLTSWPQRTPQVPALPRTSQHLGGKGHRKVPEDMMD